MSVTDWLLQAIKYLNRKRRNWRRERMLQQTDVPVRRQLVLSNPVRSVLLITVNERYGDGLFVAGLAKRLTESGIAVSIAALPQVVERFKTYDFLSHIFSLRSEEDLKTASQIEFDAAVDLEYVNVRHWRDRVRLLRQLNCYLFTVSEMCCRLHLFHEFISYRKVPHIADRLGLIFNRLTFSTKPTKIYPAISVSEMDDKNAQRLKKSVGDVNHIVYFNCMAGDEDRCFSCKQMISIIKVLCSMPDIGVIVNASHAIKPNQLPKHVVLLPAVSFGTLCALVRHCNAIVTPDTCVTHIASVWNKPTFVVFPPNDRDFYHQYAAADSWGSLAHCSETVKSDDEGLVIDPYGFGYPNHRPKPLSSISPEWLEVRVEAFMKKTFAAM